MKKIIPREGVLIRIPNNPIIKDKGSSIYMSQFVPSEGLMVDEGNTYWRRNVKRGDATWEDVSIPIEKKPESLRETFKPRASGSRIEKNEGGSNGDTI